MVSWFYPLTPEKMKEIKQRLLSRAQAGAQNTAAGDDATAAAAAMAPAAAFDEPVIHEVLMLDGASPQVPAARTAFGQSGAVPFFSLSLSFSTSNRPRVDL